MYLNARRHMAALGIQSMFLSTPYGGASTEWPINYDVTIETIVSIVTLVTQNLIDHNQRVYQSTYSYHRVLTFCFNCNVKPA